MHNVYKDGMPMKDFVEQDLTKYEGTEYKFACHAGQVTCHLSPVTCHLSPVACHLSPVTCHLSPVTCHLSLVTRHLTDLLSPDREQPAGDLQWSLGATPPLSPRGRIHKYNSETSAQFPVPSSPTGP